MPYHFVLNDKIISPSQTALFKVINIYDNIIIDKEPVYIVYKSKSKCPLILIKIDLKKAHDHISKDIIARIL